MSSMPSESNLHGAEVSSARTSDAFDRLLVTAAVSLMSTMTVALGLLLMLR